MALYQPGDNRKRQGQRGERRRAGGYSAMPVGRQFQLDFHLGRIVVDKSHDAGREEFPQEVEMAREDPNISDEEVELLSRFGNLESGNAIWLGWLVQPDGRQFRVNLTRLSEPELDAFRDAMLRAVDEARPEVQRRDKEAKHAESEGFYGLFRITRSAPQIFDRRGKKSKHDQELPVGRKGVPPVGVPEEDGRREPVDPTPPEE